MPTLEELLVTLKANTGGFNSAMTAAARGVATTSSAMKSSLSGVQGAFQKVESAIFSMQGLMVGVLATSAVAMGKKWVSAYAESEQATANLNAALQATGRYSQEASDALVKNASTLESSTTQADDAIVSATARVAQFARALTIPELQIAQRGAVGLAHVLKTDVSSAAALLGRSLASSRNMLARYGVEVDKNASQGEKLRQMMVKLEPMYAQAVAATDTLEGRTQQMKNAYNNLEETIGEVIATGLGLQGNTEQTKSRFEQLNTTLQKHKTLMSGTINFFVSLGAGILGAVATVISGLGSLLVGAGAGLTGLVSVAMHAINKLIDPVVDKLNVVVKWANSMGGSFALIQKGMRLDTSGIDNATKSMLALWKSTMSFTNDLGKETGNAFGNMLKPPNPARFPAGGNTGPLDPGGATAADKKKGEKTQAEKDLEHLKQIVESAKAPVAKLREDIAFLNKMFAAGKMPIAEYNKTLADLNQKIFSSILGPGVEAEIKEASDKFFKPAFDGLKKIDDEGVKLGSVAAEGVNKLNDAIAEGVTPTKALNQQMEILNAALKDPAITDPERIKQIGDAIVQVKKQLADLDVESKSRLDKINNAIDQFGKSTEDALINAFMGGKLAFKDMIASMLEGLARLILQITIIDPMIAALKKSMAGTTGGGGGVLGVIKGIAGIFSLGKGDGPVPLPGKAAGGPVHSGSPYIVGEKGPELFVPSVSGSIIPNGASSGGGMTFYQTINISPGVAGQVRAEIAAAMPQIKRDTTRGVMEGIQKGGSLARAVGRKA